MAKTTFTVFNLNEDFPYQAGSGFYLSPFSDGGIDPDTNNDGVADDPSTIAPAGIHADDEGIWIWLSGGGKTITFDLDGDYQNEPRSIAGMVYNTLDTMTYNWKPKNPDYNTVAPVLKDGVTPNPDFDDSNNPILPDGTSKAQTFNDECKHFNITVTVTSAKKPKAKAKAKAKDEK